MTPESGPEPAPIEPRYLKLDDVAAYLSVSVPQVYALVRSGELPAVKIGGRGAWRVDCYKLEAYLARLEKRPLSGPPRIPLIRKSEAFPTTERCSSWLEVDPGFVLDGAGKARRI